MAAPLIQLFKTSQKQYMFDLNMNDILLILVGNFSYIGYI